MDLLFWRSSGRRDILSRSMALLAGTLACYALLGWALGQRNMVGIFPASIPLHPLTALLLPIATLSLLLSTGVATRGKRWFGMLCAGVVVLAGAARLIGYAFGVGQAADRFLFPKAFAQISAAMTPITLRFAPSTALALALAGGALLVIHSRRSRLHLLGLALALAAMFIALRTISGHFIDVAALGVLVTYVPMAAGTATALAFLSISILWQLSGWQWQRFSEEGDAPATPGDMERYALQNRIAFGFGIALLVICIVGAVSYQCISQFVVDSRWDNHTYQVLAAIDDVSESLTETGNYGRGYIITGDASQRAAWDKAIAKVVPALDTVGALTDDNPVEQQRVKELRTLVARRMAFLRSLVDSRRDHGFESTRTLVISPESKALIDRIRAILASMIAEENGLLKRRIDETESNAKRGLALVIVGTLFSLTLGSLTAWLIHRGAIRRLHAQHELQAADEAMRAQNLRLVATNKELEAFSYSVSHDLRAPLRAIDGFSQLLIEDYADKLDEAGLDYLDRIRRGIQRMGDVIEAMTKLSMVSRREMAPVQVDLSRIASEVVEELRRTAPDREAEIAITMGLQVHSDAGLMRILLTNLLENAWKFTCNQPCARIEFGSCRAAGEEVYFVRDNGAGYDPTYANKLFGAFQRLHDATEFTGTGVGLATVQRIVHRHGGRVWAESEVGRGATFWFTLAATPVAPLDAASKLAG